MELKIGGIKEDAVFRDLKIFYYKIKQKITARSKNTRLAELNLLLENVLELEKNLKTEYITRGSVGRKINLLGEHFLLKIILAYCP